MDLFLYMLMISKEVMDGICEKFKISKREYGTFKYIGVNVRQEGKEKIIDQLDYAESIAEIEINPKDENKGELTEYGISEELLESSTGWQK